jgi:hypothetical protein
VVELETVLPSAGLPEVCAKVSFASPLHIVSLYGTSVVFDTVLPRAGLPVDFVNFLVSAPFSYFLSEIVSSFYSEADSVFLAASSAVVFFSAIWLSSSTIDSELVLRKSS